MIIQDRCNRPLCHASDVPDSPPAPVLPAFTSLRDMNFGATPAALNKSGAIDTSATLPCRTGF
jgi:hypothetical protein